MGLTLWRWGAGVALGCGALAAALIPFPPSVVERWSSAVPKPLERDVSRLVSDIGRTQTTLRAYHSAMGLVRWRSAPRTADSRGIRIDRSVPDDIAATVRATVAEQWRALGRSSEAHAEVFVFVDTTAIVRSKHASASKRSLEPRRFVEVTFALPEATDGSRCVALVRLLGTSAAHVDALRHQSLIGVCGFFAVFGQPGAATRNWLARTDYRFARRSDWHVALAPMTDAAAVYGIGGPGGRCLTGTPGGCLRLLGIVDSSPSTHHVSTELDFVLDAVAPLSAVDRLRGRSELGNVEGELMMAAVREFGPERFGRFWTASTTPDSAFAAAMGITLDAWVQRWMRRTFGELPERPGPRVGHVIWLAAGAPFLLLLAARPRERVLAERWRDSSG